MHAFKKEYTDHFCSVETMRGKGKEAYWLWKIKIYKFRLS